MVALGFLWWPLAIVALAIHFWLVIFLKKKNPFVCRLMRRFVQPEHPVLLASGKEVYFHEGQGAASVGFTSTYMFNNVPVVCLITGWFFAIPFVGVFARLGGAKDISDENMLNCLNDEDNSLAMMLTGTRAMNYPPSRDTIYVEKHMDSAAFRILMRTDKVIVPSLCLNEHEMFWHLRLPEQLASLTRCFLGYPWPVLYMGYGPVPLVNPHVVHGDHIRAADYDTPTALAERYYGALEHVANIHERHIEYIL